MSVISRRYRVEILCWCVAVRAALTSAL
jgi:hypothetical protein